MSLLLRKIGGIAGKIAVGVLVVIAFVIYVVVPAGVPLAARVLGPKMLGHEVRVGSVWLNPFLLRLSVNNLKVFEADKKGVMLGFDKFWVDVSWLSLFKKPYRIQSVGLKGLTVNVALLPGNRINVAELAPARTEPPARKGSLEVETVAERVEPRQKNTAPAAISFPEIVIDRIFLTRGTVTFTDQTVTPRFSTRLGNMNLSATNVSTNPAIAANAVFSTGLDEKGLIEAEAEFKPMAQPIELETTFSLNNYALSVLTPYVGKYTGRAVKSGKMELKMYYRISDNRLDARHRLLIQKFDFGDKVASKDALPLPFGLAVALLEDSQERISISLPVKGDMSKPEFEYFHLIGQVVGNFFMKLVTSPFTSLLSALGEESGTEESGEVTFEPGNARLTEKTRQRLALFAKVLKDRPKLSVEVNASYDPQADWKAMKSDACAAEFAALRADSERSDFRLYEYMYKVHFGMTAYWELAKKFTAGKKADEAALQAEMKRLIIEEGKPDRVALEALGLARAKAVYDFIIASGFDPKRIRIGGAKETRAALGQVPLEFTMTVYEAAGSPGQL